MAPSSISTIAIVTVSQAGQSRVLHPYILQPLCRRGAGALPAQVITRPCRGAGVLRRKGRQHGGMIEDILRAEVPEVTSVELTQAVDPELLAFARKLLGHETD